MPRAVVAGSGPDGDETAGRSPFLHSFCSAVKQVRKRSGGASSRRLEHDELVAACRGLSPPILNLDAELSTAAEAPIERSQLLERSAGSIGRILAGAVTRALAVLDTADLDAARNELWSILALMNL